MIADIRKRLAETPFRPFVVRVTDGREYPVPTVDHIWVPPGGGRVLVSDDEGLSTSLTGLHLCGLTDLEVRRPARRRKAA
jgi:hypothetical protein